MNTNLKSLKFLRRCSTLSAFSNSKCNSQSLPVPWLFLLLLFLKFYICNTFCCCSPLIKEHLSDDEIDFKVHTAHHNVGTHLVFKRSLLQSIPTGNIKRSSIPIATTKLPATVKLKPPVADQVAARQRQVQSSRRARKQQDSKVADVNNLFREDALDYPEEEIKLILKQTPVELKELFNVINTALDPNMNLTERVANYNGDMEENGGEFKEESVCRSVMRNIYPREANRADNTLVYVPNNQEFMQVIQAEICQNSNGECSYLRDNLPYGMTSNCVQKYAYKKLLYLDPLEKRMATDLFRYPSCCSCHVRHSSIDSRSSAQSNQTATPTNKLTSNSQVPAANSNQQQPAIGNNNNLIQNLDAVLITDRLPSATFKDSDGTKIQSNASSETALDNSYPEQGRYSRRQAKALDTIVFTDSRRNTNAQDQPPAKKPTTTEADLKVDDDVVIVDSAPQKIFHPDSPAKVSKLTKSSQQTLVLQEDKVYRPNN